MLDIFLGPLERLSQRLFSNSFVKQLLNLFLFFIIPGHYDIIYTSNVILAMANCLMNKVCYSWESLCRHDHMTLANLSNQSQGDCFNHIKLFFNFHIVLMVSLISYLGGTYM